MLRTTLLLGALTGLILGIGQWLGGSQGLIIAFVFALLMNFGSYWFSDKIVLALYGARLSGDPLGLALALQKLGFDSERIPLDASPQTAHLFIVHPLSGRSLMQLFSTHPPLEERITRLRAMAGQRA